MLFQKILYFPLVRIVLGMALCFVLLVGVQNLITKPVFYAILPSKATAGTIINYISVVVLLVSYFYIFKIYERRRITELAPRHLALDAGRSLFQTDHL